MVKDPSRKKSSLPADRHMLGVVISKQLLSALDAEVVARVQADPNVVIQRSDVVREILADYLLKNPSQRASRVEAPSKIRPVQMIRAGWINWLRDSDEPKLSAADQLEVARRIEERMSVHVEVTNDPKEDGRQGGTVFSTAVLQELLGPALRSAEDRRTLWIFLRSLKDAVRFVIVAAIENRGFDNLGPNTLSTLGNLLSAGLRRSILLRTLEHHQWSITDTAEDLGLGGGASAVLRLAQDLGLDAELDEARAQGKIRRGPRPKI